MVLTVLRRPKWRCEVVVVGSVGVVVVWEGRRRNGDG